MPEYSLVRYFWEANSNSVPEWRTLRSSPIAGEAYSGYSKMIRWAGGDSGCYRAYVTARLGEGNEGAWIRGKRAWDRSGVVVSRMGDIPVGLYEGTLFDNNVAVVIPDDQDHLHALWLFMSSEEFPKLLRSINKKISIETQFILSVPFDLNRWMERANAAPLPERKSDDPTQILFIGRPEATPDPLQVGVARLLGFRWPEQPHQDDIEEFASADGIACLPPVLGERSAADRLQELLSKAFRTTLRASVVANLLKKSGSKKTDLESWLRDDFFKAHCQLFKNRPFVWHIWDGRKDGFAAIVNYNRLDRLTLERLTYTYLGDWIERQTAGVREDIAGSEERLAAARGLRHHLEKVIEGEPPYDIYARWKTVAEQPVGWDPDPNDGVRINVRPFVEVGILRARFQVKWDNDRGMNPDGSERLNNLHYTHAQKHAARGGSTS